MSEKFESIKPCDKCGSLISVHKTLDGAVYFIPVSDEYLKLLIESTDVEFLVRDRLQRAEHIIVDLRKQVRELQKTA